MRALFPTQPLIALLSVVPWLLSAQSGHGQASDGDLSARVIEAVSSLGDARAAATEDAQVAVEGLLKDLDRLLEGSSGAVAGGAERGTEEITGAGLGGQHRRASTDLAPAWDDTRSADGQHGSRAPSQEDSSPEEGVVVGAPAQRSGVRDRGEQDRAQAIYRYRGEGGREVFTNLPGNLPLAERNAARVNLANISLNSGVGGELAEQLSAAHARIARSPECAAAQALIADAGPLAVLHAFFERYAPLIVCGLLLLGFIVVSPFMVRRVDPAAWRRVLLFAIPALTVAGVSTQALLGVGRGLSSFAEGCAPSTFAQMTAAGAPLSERFQLLSRLKSQLAEMREVEAAALAERESR